MNFRCGQVARRWALIIALGLMQSAALAQTPPFSNKEIGFLEKRPKTFGFQRPRTDVMGSIKTVGVMPIDGQIAADIPGAAEVLTRVENEMVARLKEAGFNVVPPDELRASREAAATTVGAMFDPKTGAADELKLEQYQQLIWKDYRERHKVDGYVMSAIVVSPATENNGESGWDGVTDSTTGLGALANFMSGSKREMAILPAMSVAVWLTDPDFQVQYLASGGLHLMMYLRKPLGAPIDYVEVASAPEILDQPRVVRAMDVIFDPMYKSAKQIQEERRKGMHRYALKYAPALGERAPDGSEFINAETFRANYPRIFVTPVQWSSDARGSNKVHALEQQLMDKLTKLDKAVVHPDRLLDALMAELQQAPDLYNPRNGTFVKAAFEATRARAFESIARDAPFDAVLYPSIVAQPAVFESGEAHWVGTQQVVTGDATSLQAKLNKAGRQIGTVTALVLQLRLTDRSGKLLYVGSGGIELTAFLRDGGFVPRSDWDLLSDKERNAAAINFALKRLLQTEPKK
jgi:hypothetical protein